MHQKYEETWISYFLQKPNSPKTPRKRGFGAVELIFKTPRKTRFSSVQQKNKKTKKQGETAKPKQNAKKNKEGCFLEKGSPRSPDGLGPRASADFAMGEVQRAKEALWDDVFFFW